MIEKLKVIDYVYHRNGISGVGFYAIDFTWEEFGKDHHAIGTVSTDDIEAFRGGDPYDPDTRILMFDAAGKIDISETMRGDHFHQELVDYVIKTQLGFYRA